MQNGLGKPYVMVPIKRFGDAIVNPREVIRETQAGLYRLHTNFCRLIR